MADFMQAVKWMKEGKKVRRESMPAEWFYFIEGDTVQNEFGNLKNRTYFCVEDFEATDWEIYRDETSTKFLKRAGTDGTLWAKEFMKLFGDEKDKIDEGLMIGWFCNAIEAGKSAT